MLRYLADETEWRSIGRQLNNGEALHAAIFFAGEQARAPAHAGPPITQVHRLHRVANAIITWNAVYMSRALDHLGDVDDGRLARLSRTHAHIYPHGAHSFDPQACAPNGVGHLRDPRNP